MPCSKTKVCVSMEFAVFLFHHELRPHDPGVCGWIKEKQDFMAQWKDLTACQQSNEAFTLVWESKELMELNSAIVDFAASQAGQEAAKW
jgi:hypothetical protein